MMLEEQGMIDKHIEIATIIIVVCAIFTVFAFYHKAPDTLQEQMICYNKIMNSTDFWIFREIQNANKTFIYCEKDLAGICYCKFYWGSGMVTYKDEALKGDMPYYLEKK
jgi:hypothetical protein